MEPAARAGHEDYAAMRRSSWSRLLADLEALPKGRLLDAGAGSGDMSASTAALGYSVTALDFFGQPPQAVLDRYGVTFVKANLEVDALPFPDDHFDVILLLEVLEHLRHYVQEPLQELRRILKPGGRLFLTTPNATCLQERWRLLRGKTIYHPVDWLLAAPVIYRGIPFRDCHVRAYTLEELGQVLTAAGFDLLRLEYHPCRRWRPSLYCRLSHALGGLRDMVPGFRKSLLAVATKQ